MAKLSENKQGDLEITLEDFEFICRTCLYKSNVLFAIDSEISEMKISLKYLINTCLSLEANETDPLPQSICVACITELLKINQFRTQCSENEKSLKLLLSSTAPGPETPSNSKKRNSGSKTPLDTIDGSNKENILNNSTSAATTESIIIITDSESVTDEKLESEERILNNNSSSPSQNEDPWVEHYLNPSSSNEKVNTEEVENFSCVVCEMSFPDRKTLRIHAKKEQHLQRKKKMCEICGKMYHSHILRQHVLYTHKQKKKNKVPGKKLLCDICGKICSRSLESHYRIHLNERPFKCQICGGQFIQSHNLKRHMMVHSGEKPFACDICGKGFTQQAALISHKFVIHYKKPSPYRQKAKQEKNNPDNENIFNGVYTCGICDQVFKKSGPYFKHLDTHDNLTTTTTTTEKSIVKVKGIRFELKEVENEKLFFCSVCGKGLKKKTCCYSHALLHSEDRPFKCKYCPKKFRANSTLMCHMWIHTGIKNYNCELCSRKFRQKSHLIYHMRCHNNEKNYACPHCDKRFTLKGNLTVHIRTHTGQRPYQCPECDNAFYDSSSRKRHCLKVHGVLIKKEEPFESNST